MRKAVVVQGVTIGEGLPKICTPMVGRTKTQLMEEANFIKNLGVDLVEWRADFFEAVQDTAKVQEVLRQIRQVLVDLPIIFTVRSHKEGGQIHMTPEFYFQINKMMVATKLIDLIDIELCHDNEEIEKLIDLAHQVGVKVILSSHDFEKTPRKDEIILRLQRAIALGCDIPKIAVMPNTAADVITLLDATRIMKETYADGPIIAISMGGKGLISRLTGEIFGSDITFATAKNSSAPGQVSVQDLRGILNLIHNNID